MSARVKIADIVDELQMQFDGASAFLDLETGQVRSFRDDEIREAEEFLADEDPEDLSEEDKILLRAAAMDRMLHLPSKFDVHEWQIMKDFAVSRPNAVHRHQVENVLHGKGAFRRFRDTATRLGMIEHWYAFRDQALRQIAIEWCEANKLEWE